MKVFKYAALFLALHSLPAFADAIEIGCPNVDKIKQGDIYPWIPEYIDSQQYVSAVDFTKFQTHLKKFEKARWDTSYYEKAHCFYSGDDSILNTIVIALDAFEPLPSPHWQWITDKSAECHSSLSTQCMVFAYVQIDPNEKRRDH
jgi:hypothetical protein